jgi:peptidoglycan/xylan/chitin deacetylase (PgdA/CDA1 family)
VRSGAAKRRGLRAVAILAVLALLGGIVAVVLLARGGGHERRAAPVAKTSTHAPPPPRRVVPRGPHNRRVPILMYHELAVPPANAPYPELYVRPADFAAQIHWLDAHGYEAVTLDRVLAYWRGRATLPRRPVVLTFDDGYRSDYTVAMPVLRARGWSGVLNLQVGNMVPLRVRALIRAGWEVDAHTFTHPDLTTVGATQLRREIAGSRGAIRRLYGVPVNTFCYPAGRYDTGVIAAVRAAGYEAATTTQPGLAGPAAPYELARVRIDGSDGVGGFVRKLAAAGAATA